MKYNQNTIICQTGPGMQKLLFLSFICRPPGQGMIVAQPTGTDYYKSSSSVSQYKKSPSGESGPPHGGGGDKKRKGGCDRRNSLQTVMPSPNLSCPIYSGIRRDHSRIRDVQGVCGQSLFSLRMSRNVRV